MCFCVDCVNPLKKKSKNYLIKFTFYFGIKWFRPTTPSVQQIDPFLCTHLILIGDCWLDEDARTIRFPSTRVITELVALKNSNPDLKILVTFSPANRLISQMVCLHFLRQNEWKTFCAKTNENFTALKGVKILFPELPTRSLFPLSNLRPFVIVDELRRMTATIR